MYQVEEGSLYCVKYVFFRKAFSRHRVPNADEGVPISIKNVILFFPVMEKSKKNGRNVDRIPSATRERLWNDRHLIFSAASE